MAPFQAVPAPEPRLELSSDDPFLPASPTATPAAAARGDLLERPSRVQAAPAPALPRREGVWPDAEPSLASTGPSGLRSRPAPQVPRQTTADGSSSLAYGDWTKPSRSGDGPFATDPELLSGAPLPRRSAPGTTAIPERSVRGRRSADELDAEPEEPTEAAAPVRESGTGPVGGRAAMRAERQAADAVRRKAEKRSGSAVAVLDEDEPRKPRRVLKGLIALTVVALVVLGVYSYVSPETKETAAKAPAGPSSAAPVVPDTSSLPALPTDPIEVEPIVAAPVRVPVTVLNSTTINGLAAKVAAAVAAGGWETPAVGAYTAGDVAASTVFFTEGDENQRQAALQLIEQFPQLQGPTARFFEVPADVQAPGLVVVTTGDWQP
ncbi:LytR C-terminal domain-containing protein [Blastococcus mobilis]|uniref:LytR C-terminal domain-containing protein n=1 Tax=Blastococcus mobilis TaxID=1938746 RepID=UPI001130B218|nr:LytR C-terminal domain-containing protein [Blastococcus mobilis]